MINSLNISNITSGNNNEINNDKLEDSLKFEFINLLCSDDIEVLDLFLRKYIHTLDQCNFYLNEHGFECDKYEIVKKYDLKTNKSIQQLKMSMDKNAECKSILWRTFDDYENKLSACLDIVTKKLMPMDKK